MTFQLEFKESYIVLAFTVAFINMYVFILLVILALLWAQFCKFYILYIIVSHLLAALWLYV